MTEAAFNIFPVRIMFQKLTLSPKLMLFCENPAVVYVHVTCTSKNCSVILSVKSVCTIKTRKQSVANKKSTFVICTSAKTIPKLTARLPTHQHRSRQQFFDLFFAHKGRFEKEWFLYCHPGANINVPNFMLSVAQFAKSFIVMSNKRIQ